MGSSAPKQNINNKKLKNISKKAESEENSEVKFFSEDESSSGTFSLNDNTNKENSDKEEEKSTKSKKSTAVIRVFDYSSDDSESEINYEVIDLTKKKEPPPKPKPEPAQEPKKKKSIQPPPSPPPPEPPKEEIPRIETPPHKEESVKEEIPEKESPKKEKIPSPKKEEPKKEEPKKEILGKKRRSKFKTVMPRSKRLSKPVIIVEESVSSEFESEKIDSPHPSIILESNIKENIFREYSKNLNFYDDTEKNKSYKLLKESYDTCPKNKYRKNILLHNEPITSICTLDGITKEIAYATSSLDNTIKFWTGKFKLVDTLAGLLVPSTYLCEFDFINVLSAEGVYIKMYDIESDIYECKYTFRDHIEIITVIFPIVTKNTLNFLSGGKDNIIRLWQRDSENPVRYYEGHKGPILDIKNLAGNKKLMVSLSEDKKCIIWEISNSNMIKEIDLYFTPINLIETENGFGIGGFDNKIRLYYDTEKECELKECVITKFYGNQILFGDSKNIFSLDATGNVNLMDIVDKKMVIIFESNNADFIKIIKSYDWNPNKDEFDNSQNKRFGEDRTIIGINKDGYAYTYKSELFKNLKIYPREIFRKKEDLTRKKDKGKTFMKPIAKRGSGVPKIKSKRVSFNY